MTPTDPLTGLIYYFGLIGVFLFAISGGLAAGRKKLDWVGVIILGLVTSMGGGTIRDVLLNRTVFWIESPEYLVSAFLGAVCIIATFPYIGEPARLLLYADALALAVFSVVGAQIALSAGTGPAVAIVMGITTGAGGGLIRDVLTSEIPLVFRSTETLYTTAAFGGLVLYLALGAAGLPRPLPALAGMSAISAIRLAAIYWSIRLPAFHVRD